MTSEDKLATDFLRCSKCKRTNYCSEDCQKKDWPEHKKQCTEHNVLSRPNPLFERHSAMTVNPDTQETNRAKGLGIFATGDIRRGHVYESVPLLFGIHTFMKKELQNMKEFGKQIEAMNDKLISLWDTMFEKFPPKTDVYIRLTYLALVRFPWMIRSQDFQRMEVLVSDNVTQQLEILMTYKDDYTKIKAIRKDDIINCYSNLRRYAHVLTDVNGTLSLLLITPNTIFLNHECTPNSKLFYKDGQVHLMAMRKIKNGEELTINYKEFLGTVVNCRREVLLNKHCFVCECDHCSKEEIDIIKFSRANNIDLDQQITVFNENQIKLAKVIGQFKDKSNEINETLKMKSEEGYKDVLISRLSAKLYHFIHLVINDPDVIEITKTPIPEFGQSVCYNLLTVIFSEITLDSMFIKILMILFAGTNPEGDVVLNNVQLLSSLLNFLSRTVSWVENPNMDKFREARDTYNSSPFFLNVIFWMFHINLFLTDVMDSIPKDRLGAIMRSYPPTVVGTINDFLFFSNKEVRLYKEMFHQEEVTRQIFENCHWLNSRIDGAIRILMDYLLYPDQKNKYVTEKYPTKK